MSEYPIVNISVEPIELCKLLKIANMVGGGGEAKIVISEGYVLVNNEVEFQKRKKIRHADIVEFNGEVIEVAFVPNKKVVNAPKTVASSSKKKKKSKNKIATYEPEQIIEPSSKRSKRKSISF